MCEDGYCGGIGSDQGGSGYLKCAEGVRQPIGTATVGEGEYELIRPWEMLELVEEQKLFWIADGEFVETDRGIRRSERTFDFSGWTDLLDAEPYDVIIEDEEYTMRMAPARDEAMSSLEMVLEGEQVGI